MQNKSHKTSFNRLRVLSLGLCVFGNTSTGCVAATTEDVDLAANAIYRGTISLREGDTRSISLPDGTSVEYSLVGGGWQRPVPVDFCPAGLCEGESDIANVEAWRMQYAFQTFSLRVVNRSSAPTTSN